jgi:hypothetical protein
MIESRALLLAGLLLALLFALHCAYYWPFLSDDALVSLRYATRLASGSGLTWTDGERVEGYSNLLWVLLTAGGKLLGFDLIGSARALGGLGACSALILAGITPHLLRLSLPRLIGGGLVLALSSPLAVWAIGGLEQGFMAGVLALALVAWSRVLSRSRFETRSDRPRAPIGAFSYPSAGGS